MTKKMSWTMNQMQKTTGVSTDFLSSSEMQKVKAFHMSFPEYAETPLRSLENLSKRLEVKGIYVKDESYRFGLNAFKVLGASFAIAKYLAKRLQRDIGELSFSMLASPEVREQLGEITFVTATDGNHGRGVAWAARQLQQKSVVYMPKGSSLTRLENIRAEGATASITELNYDEAVRLAAGKAEEHGWVMVQDTAWEGYEEIPEWIMQGYGTIATESLEQLQRVGVEKPTHVFVQAGVGSFAGAIQGCFASLFGHERPKTVVVEANVADCLYQSAIANDEKPRIVGGEMNTIMAGLACGEPNHVGWNILRDYSDLFFSCPDEVAAKGMRMLGNPMGSDCRVISGESGAVTAGLLALILEKDCLAEVKKSLQLNQDSCILLISTEGDTDPEKYRSIVWDGEYPSCQ
ncbi:diaminopropionate ammonia-lyase [Pelosinus sp. sgz500959]|uniref:diaminopropionate ammonia-lyase n=1 Tax=Pelosinus sp. sgz500959 TaxID=3242472 RepID=UPI00366A6B34